MFLVPMGRWAFAVKDGVISAVGEISDDDAAEVIDAAGCLVSPSFCDTHTHLDKAFQMEYPEYRDKVRELEAEYYWGDEVDYGCPVCGGSEPFLMEKLKGENGDDGLREIICTRISRACDMAIANGTGLIKTNNTWGPLPVEVVEGLKQEYAGKIDLKNIVIYTGNTEECDSCAMTAETLEEYCASGAVDFLGGYFDGDYGYESIDGLFELASKYGCPSTCTSSRPTCPCPSPSATFSTRPSSPACRARSRWPPHGLGHPRHR